MNNNTNTQVTQAHSAAVIAKTNEDFKHAVLVVSIVANVFVLTAWLVAQASSEYAAQLSSLI